jgi:hypothetical protein
MEKNRNNILVSICALVFLRLISNREGVRVYTVGPNGLYSCFIFHTNTSQFWQARLAKAPYRNNISLLLKVNVCEIRVVQGPIL